jgi:hypothetical protein
LIAGSLDDILAIILYEPSSVLIIAKVIVLSYSRAIIMSINRITAVYIYAIASDNWIA